MKVPYDRKKLNHLINVVTDDDLSFSHQSLRRKREEARGKEVNWMISYSSLGITGSRQWQQE